GPENVRNERLRVAVHERKPRGLDLNHDPVTLLKRVVHVRKFECDLRHLSRAHWFGLLVAAAEAGAKRLSAYEHLIAGGPEVGRIRLDIFRIVWVNNRWFS